MGLTPDDLRELLAAFEQSTWQEMTVTVSGDSLSVSRRAEAAREADGTSASRGLPSPVLSPESSAVAEPPAATAGPAAAEAGAPAAPPRGTPVLAPSVGLFWHAPSPGAPPFVDIGRRVGPEDVVGIVEVMKLMNRVTAGVAGVVSAVLVDNGGMVEHGQPLVLIDTGA